MVGGTPEQDAWITRVLGFRDWAEDSPPVDIAVLQGAVPRLAIEVKAAIAAAPQAAAALTAGQASFEAQVAAGRVSEAEATLRNISAAMEALAPPKLPEPETPLPPAELARQSWEAARASAVGPLREIVARISKAEHPGAAKASLQLRSVIKTLAMDPATKNEVTEMERWISSDDVVADVERPNGFGITVDLRAPLLRALRELKPFLED